MKKNTFLSEYKKKKKKYIVGTKWTIKDKKYYTVGAKW